MVGKQNRVWHRTVVFILLLVCAGVVFVLVQKVQLLNPKEFTSSTNLSGKPASVADTATSINQALLGIDKGVSALVYSDVTDQEAQLGRRYDIVHIPYTSWQNVLDWSRTTTAIATKPEYKFSSEGRIVHLSVVLPESWSSMAFNLRNPGSGRRSEVEQFAKHLQAFLPGPFLISINDLPENSRNDNAGNSPQDYTDTVCAFYQIFKAQGAIRARFAYVTAVDRYGNTFDAGARFYPGDQCIDWVGVQAFNAFQADKLTNWHSLKEILKTGNPADMKWYDWATKDWTGDGSSFNNPTRFGVVTNLDGKQETKNAKGKKPLLLAAWATREDSNDPGRKGQWLVQARADIASGLHAVKALEYYDVNAFQDKSAVCYGSDWSVVSTLQSGTGDKSCPRFDTRQYIHSYDGASFQAWKAFSLTGYFNVSKAQGEGDANGPAAQKRFQFFLDQK